MIATDLHEDAPALASEVDGAGEIVYRRLDVSRPEDWHEVSSWLAEDHGRVDGLVQNAGIPFRERLQEVALAGLGAGARSVNLTGSLLGIQTLVAADGPPAARS